MINHIFSSIYTRLLLLLSMWSVTCGAVTFSSPLEVTSWQLDASIFSCKLYQNVDLYGEAVFLRRAGESQRFYLHEDNKQLASGQATIRALTPLWEAVAKSEVIGKVQVVNDENPIQMDWMASQGLVGYLQHGQRLMFSHEARYEANKDVHIMLEPIRFDVAFNEYQTCLELLLPVNYDQVHRTALYFSVSGEEFNDFNHAQKEKLDHLIRYVLADKYVTALKVDGHTDSQGMRAENLELSKRRAEIVTQYLLERGVPKELITTRWHGERYPKVSNRTTGGRTKNRRVTIRLDRFDKDFPAIADRHVPARKKSM